MSTFKGNGGGPPPELQAPEVPTVQLPRKFVVIITYDMETDNAAVQGPIGHKGLCYAALQRGMDAVREFDVDKQSKLIGHVDPALAAKVKAS